MFVTYMIIYQIQDRILTIK